MLRRPTPRRLAVGAATAVAALLALSGCFRVDMAMTIHSDDTVDGSAVIAIDKSILSMTGATIDDVIPDDTMDGDGRVEPFEEGDLVGKRFVFENTPLSEFNEDSSDGEALTITHVDDTYVVDGTLDMSSGEEGGDDEGAGAALSGGTVKVAFTFPGEIVEANGDIDEETNTVTWSPSDPSVPLEMHAVGKDGSSSGIALWMYVAGGAALLVVIGVVVLLVVRSRRDASAPAEPFDVGYAPAPQPVASWSPTPPAPQAPPAPPPGSPQL